METITKQRISFQHILSGTILLFFLIILYYSVIFHLISDWSNDPNYSHGFIVLLISGYLIWKRRSSLENIELTPSTWGIGLLIGGLVIFVLGNLAVEGDRFSYSFVNYRLMRA